MAFNINSKKTIRASRKMRRTKIYEDLKTETNKFKNTKTKITKIMTNIKTATAPIAAQAKKTGSNPFFLMILILGGLMIANFMNPTLFTARASEPSLELQQQEAKQASQLEVITKLVNEEEEDIATMARKIQEAEVCITARLERLAMLEQNLEEVSDGELRNDTDMEEAQKEEAKTCDIVITEAEEPIDESSEETKPE